MGLVGIAAMFSTFVAIDGPLLQKATTIDLAPIVAPPFDLNVTMAQRIPTDLTGSWDNSGKWGRWTQAFNKTIPMVNGEISNIIYSTKFMANGVAEQWMGGEVSGIVHGCPQSRTCNATVVAPALAVTSCTSHVVPVDYWDPIDLRLFVGDMTVAPPFSTFAFLIDTDLILDNGIERINLVTGYTTNQNCTGTFNYSTYTLESSKHS